MIVLLRKPGMSPRVLPLAAFKVVLRAIVTPASRSVTFGLGSVASFIGEFSKLRDRDLVRAQVERLGNPHLMNRLLIGQLFDPPLFDGRIHPRQLLVRVMVA